MQFEEFSPEAQRGIEKFRKFITNLDFNKFEHVRYSFFGPFLVLKECRVYDIRLSDLLFSFLIQENLSSQSEINNCFLFAKEKNYWCSK